MLKKILLIILSIVFVSACAARPKPEKISTDNYNGYYKIGKPYKIDDKWYYPKEDPDYDEVGVSSWYGDKFHGKKTANGDTFDKRSLTAAHNTLPLPSMVRVTNLENNKTLILMINDRGPFAKGRVIDVSERASEILGFKDKGIAKVRVQFLKGQTNRLLANIDRAPQKDDKKFSFFTKKEKSPFDADYDENDPVELLPQTGGILEPVKKLSKIFNNDVKVDPSMPIELDNLPQINIADPVVDESDIATEDNNDYLQPKPIIQQDPIQQQAVKEPTPAAVPEPDIDEEIVAAVQELEESIDLADIGDWEDEAGYVVDPTEPVDKMIEEEAKEKMAKAEKARMEEELRAQEEPQIYVQAGTYSVKKNAQRVESALKALGDVVITEIDTNSRKLFRVRLGPIPNDEIAQIALKKVVRLGHPDAMLVKDLASLQ